MSTFLLEVALDRRRVKARLAALLVEERGRRSPDGDPRGFPQPKMADLLGYSLRQYQRLEDPDDGSLPRFDDMQQLLEKLDRDAGEIYGGEELPDDELTPLAPTDADRLAALEQRVEGVRELVEEVLREIRGSSANEQAQR